MAGGRQQGSDSRKKEARGYGVETKDTALPDSAARRASGQVSALGAGHCVAQLEGGHVVYSVPLLCKGKCIGEVRGRFSELLAVLAWAAAPTYTRTRALHTRAPPPVGVSLESCCNYCCCNMLL